MKNIKNIKLFEAGQNEPETKKEEKKVKTPFLDEFGKDLTKMASENKLEPIHGRDKEILQILLILARKTKNNPVIIGEPGVGKTAIVEGIAQMIMDEEKCPQTLQGKRIVYIDMGTLIAGASKQGEFEKRVKTLMYELENNKDIILFIDEIHMMVNPTMAIDAANMFKPALARGDMRLIGATTNNEYRNSIEKDGALERRFQKVIIEQPSVDETIAILNKIKSRYEDYHQVKYSDDSIIACVKLSGKYMPDRFYPDKAIDLLDEVGARSRVLNGIREPEEVKVLLRKLKEIVANKNKAFTDQDYEESSRLRKEERETLEQISELRKNAKGDPITITPEDVAQIVAAKTGIPIEKFSQDEGERLLNMEKELSLQVIGQSEAISKVSKCIRRNRVGLKSKQKPQGVFLFLGTTGTGKCHGKGTKILMYDGSIKNVEDVIVGDLLMGDDSTPRTVLSLARGRDRMYEIESKNGDSFTCNNPHILSLKKTGTYEIVNIPLNEYLEKSKTFKHLHKLWKTKVEFESKEVSIDPYLIGLWIGDGDKNRVGVTTADDEIVKYLESVSNNYGLHLNVRNLKNNKSNTYYISGENHKNNNTLLEQFRSYGLIDKSSSYKKFIPDEYLKNSTDVRKKLLAGLIDSDGHLDKCKCYTISTKYKELADQIIYLCRSLGYKSHKSVKKISKYPLNTYYNINISGDFSDIPSLLDRKKCGNRLQKKNVNLTGFNVKYIGIDDYYGFELDGNHLYLLGDFTVTHNTHTVKTLAKYLFGTEEAMFRVDMSEYGEKHNVSRLIGSPPGYVGYGEGGQLTEKVRRKPYCIVLLDEIEKAHPDVLNVLLQVFDEGHLTDGGGRKVDFKNTIIVMTSNIGASAVRDMNKIKHVGFKTASVVDSESPEKVEERTKKIIEAELSKKLAPEFINRIDDIIIFKSLGQENIYKIIDTEIAKVQKNAKEMGYDLTISDNCRKFLMSVGFNDEMGARPMGRAIQTYIEDPISDEILRKKIKDKIDVDYDFDKKAIKINGELVTEKFKFLKRSRLIIETKFNLFANKKSK